MDIQSLNLFIEVMGHRSFTDVANRHGVAPSSISRSIASLEKELGIRLFQRSTRKLVPTEAGLTYFEKISPLVRELETAKQVALDITEEPKGTLRVTAPSVYGQMYMAPLLPILLSKYPSLSIELILTDAYLDLIEERIDVAIRVGTLKDSSYIVRQLRPMQFYICASTEYIKRFGEPIVPEDIKKHECLIFPRTGKGTNWLFKDKKGNISNVSIHGRCLVTNSLVIKQCAVEGMGLVLLPDWNVDKEIENEQLTRLFKSYSITGTDYNGGVYILYPSRDYMPLKTKVFIDHLLN